MDKTTSLTWLDALVFRAIKEGGETAASLATQDIDYLLKINEYLDIQNFFEEDINRQMSKK